MSFHISIYAREVGLVEHGDFEFLRFGGGGKGGGDDKVEGSLEDGGIGDRVDRVEGKEFKGFFEAPDDAGGEEEEEA